MVVAVIAVAEAERAAVRAAAAVNPILWDVIVKTGQVLDQDPPFK